MDFFEVFDHDWSPLLEILMDELTRYAHDLIAIQCKNLFFILPLDGSMTVADFHRLGEVIFDLDPSFNLNLQPFAEV